MHGTGGWYIRKISQNQKDQTCVLYHTVQMLIFPVWCVYVTLVSGEFTAYCVCAHMCVYTQIRRAEVRTECLSSIVLHLYFLRQGFLLSLKFSHSGRQGAHGGRASRIHLPPQLAFTRTVVGMPSERNRGQPCTCVLSTQIQVFILAQHVLYQPSYLPSPVVKILNNTQ